MSAVKLKDVAKKAGVGIGTASRVLNNHPNVSPKTRKKVLDTIQELGYQPDEIARSLKTKSTKNIGVILHDITNPFYADVLKGLEREASDSGFSIVLIDLLGQNKTLKETVLNLYKSKVDGVIFMGSIIDDRFAQIFDDVKLPAVFASTRIDTTEAYDGKIHSVNIDNMKASYEVVNMLIELGHKDIAIILGAKNDPNSTYLRKKGYEKAMSEKNIPLNDKFIYYGDFSYKSGYEAAKSIIASESNPSAIFAISDLMAIGAAKAFLESGYKIPDDISIFGFDGVNNGLYFYPEISTVNQPRYEMGRVSSSMIISLIADEDIEKKQIVLDHEIILRESIRKL